jgi:hypothetical protein
VRLIAFTQFLRISATLALLTAARVTNRAAALLTIRLENSANARNKTSARKGKQTDMFKKLKDF